MNPDRKSLSLTLVVYLALAGLFVPTFYKLATYGWRQADYSHGPIILVAFLWLLWRKRDIASVPVDDRFHPVSFGVLLAGIALYLLGSIHRTIMLETFSLIPVLIGMTGFLYGRRRMLHILFPVVFLIFLVPPPLFLIDMITSPLKEAVAAASASLMDLAGYIISRNGVSLFIGDYSIIVGDACSGVRSLVSLMAVGAVYAYLQNISNLKKSVLFLSIIPISIFANIVRLIVLALITFHFGEAAGQGFFHNFSGVLLFVVAMMSLVIFDVVMDRLGRRNEAV